MNALQHDCQKSSGILEVIRNEFLLLQVPNWGGLLKRVEKAGSTQADWGSFDILFVVDGSRSWYSGEMSKQNMASMYCVSRVPSSM